MKLIEFIDKIKTPIFSQVGQESGAREVCLSGLAGIASEASTSQPSARTSTQTNTQQNTIIFHFKYQEKQYPEIFFYFFIKKFKQVISPQIGSEVINLASCENMIVKSKLETTFLGQKKLYWLEGLSELKPKEQAAFISYLENYCGPNFVCFCSDQSVNLGLNKNKLIVDIDNFVDQKDFTKLVEFFLDLQPNSAKSFNKITLDIFSRNNKFTLNNRVTLDQACMLLNYTYLAGSQYKDFLDSWVNKIMASDKSLFTLSQYFFERNARVFANLWQEIKDDYPEQFWLTFWSEQVWRACNYVKLMQDKKIVEAKKISFRLPFSFMQKSWRNFTVSELVNAHKFLYSIDYSLKNGGDVFSIDLFYFKFLSGNFKQDSIQNHGQNFKQK